MKVKLQKDFIKEKYVCHISHTDFSWLISAPYTKDLRDMEKHHLRLTNNS